MSRSGNANQQNCEPICMILFDTLTARMQRKNRQNRHWVEKLLVKAANVRNLPVRHDEILIVSRQKDLTAAATVLPSQLRSHRREEDLLFLYLDLEEMDELNPGFYRVRIHQGPEGEWKQCASLLDADGRFVRACGFLRADPHEAILGIRPDPHTRHTLVDSWIRRGEAYAIEGVLEDGSPFIVTLEF